MRNLFSHVILFVLSAAALRAAPESIEVDEVSGYAYAEDASGAIRQLEKGSVVFPGEKVTTAPNAKVIIGFSNGVGMQVNGDSTFGVKLFQQVSRPDDAKKPGEKGYSLININVEKGGVFTVAPASLNPASSVCVTAPNGARSYLDGNEGCYVKGDATAGEMVCLKGVAVVIPKVSSKITQQVGRQEVLSFEGEEDKISQLGKDDFNELLSQLDASLARKLNSSGNQNQTAPDSNLPQIVQQVQQVINDQVRQAKSQINPSPTGG